jgi:hypothetical protein
LIDDKSKAFFVYPNPAKTNATIVFTATGNYSLKITDLSGKILQTKTGTAMKGENIINLDISMFARGSYFVTLVDDKKQLQNLKLQKE